MSHFVPCDFRPIKPLQHPNSSSTCGQPISKESQAAADEAPSWYIIRSLIRREPAEGQNAACQNALRKMFVGSFPFFVFPFLLFFFLGIFTCE